MLTTLAPAQWDREKAAHLLNRAGFGGPPEQIDALAQGGMAAAVRELVAGPATPVPAPAPDWAHPGDRFALREKIRDAMMEAPAGDQAARQQAKREFAKDFRKTEVTRILDLGSWWVDRMRNSPDPLGEKLALFWHGHFATSAQKVKQAYEMWRQNETFREYARGNFGGLVKAMSRDPAMIFWLDLQQSRAAHANENFARELMELFTLGEGNYTEKDVTEGARAFTGYRVDPRDETFHLVLREHDSGVKQFLGQAGNFDGDQAIDVILQQPACAHFIASKLWTFFAYENPAPAVVESLAHTMRASNYEMRPVLTQLFTSAEFYSPNAIRNQVKSPIQWIVQTSRTLETGLPPARPLFGALRQMGQVPFSPPSVKGWDGGKAWISTSTLLFRYNFAGAFLHGVGPGIYQGANPGGEAPPPMMAALAAAAGPGGAGPSQTKPDLQKLAPPSLRANPVQLVQALTMRLFQDPLNAKEQQAFVDYLKAVGPQVTDEHVIGLLHLMMSTPSYQLC